ncbi:MAG: hypothetical protein E7264_06605 [Lachnospiraceae bacterium]|nr:hypothetical protein [Lachnospiraceae bacterium]
MATFDVKISSIKNEADDFDKMAKKLEKHYDSISDIKKSLSGVLGSSGASIGNSLGTVMSQIQSEQKSCAAISNSLESIAQTYTNAEKALVPGYDAGVVKDAQSGDAKGGDDPSFWDNYKSNFWSNLPEAILTSGGETVARVGGLINVVTATARSASTTNGFVIINPSVMPTTSKMISIGTKVATGAKIGLPIIGGIIDYAGMRSSGVGRGEAANKAIAHTAIGLAGGAAGAKIGAAIGTAIPVPVVGTVVGAVAGFVIGVGITTLGSMAFDYVYDNWDDITETAKEIGTAVVDGAKAAGKAVVDGAKCIAEGIGNAASSVGKFWGTVFG